MRKHGIPVSFIKDVVKSCEVCKSMQKHVDFDAFPDLHNKNGKKILSKEVMVTNRCSVDGALANIMIKHKVRLIFVHSTQ